MWKQFIKHYSLLELYVGKNKWILSKHVMDQCEEDSWVSVQGQYEVYFDCFEAFLVPGFWNCRIRNYE